MQFSLGFISVCLWFRSSWLGGAAPPCVKCCKRKTLSTKRRADERQLWTEDGGWILTYDRHLATAPRTVTLFVARPARVDTRIRVLLHGANGQRAIRLHTLAYIIGQLASAALPVYLLDGITGHGAFQIQCLARDSGHLRYEANVGQA